MTSDAFCSSYCHGRPPPPRHSMLRANKWSAWMTRCTVEHTTDPRLVFAGCNASVTPFENGWGPKLAQYKQTRRSVSFLAPKNLLSSTVFCPPLSSLLHCLLSFIPSLLHFFSPPRFFFDRLIWMRSRFGDFTAFAAKTPPLPRASTPFVAKTPPFWQRLRRLDHDDRQHERPRAAVAVAVGETAILLHPPLSFNSCFSGKERGASEK